MNNTQNQGPGWPAGRGRGRGMGRGLRMLLNNPELLNDPRVRARIQNLNGNQQAFLNQVSQQLGQNQSQQRDDSQASSGLQHFNNDLNLPPIDHLLIFPPSPFTSPITSVTSPLVRVFPFAGTVSSLLRSSEPSQWLSQHTVSDTSLVDDILLNFIHFTHSDCPAPESHKSAALMYIMLYKPIGNLLRDGEGWHRDPSPWPMDGHIPTRYAITLLGAPTRMLDPSLGSDPELGKIMPRLYAAERPLQLGQIVRFSMGRMESPVHAAPEITSDRVFVNIVYGSEEEVKANRKNIPWRG